MYALVMTNNLIVRIEGDETIMQYVNESKLVK